MMVTQGATPDSVCMKAASTVEGMRQTCYMIYQGLCVGYRLHSCSVVFVVYRGLGYIDIRMHERLN